MLSPEIRERPEERKVKTILLLMRSVRVAVVIGSEVTEQVKCLCVRNSDRTEKVLRISDIRNLSKS